MGRVILGAMLTATLAWCVVFGVSEARSQAQTDVQGGRHHLDDNGVVTLSIEKVGTVYHPAWIALYALAYGGDKPYSADHDVAPDPHRFAASINWLEKNLKQTRRGLWAWEYDFDSTYNDVTVTAPWSSAFGQAAGIEALVLAYKKTNVKRYLETALKAAQILFEPLAAGGLLFQQGDEIWFEEIPSPGEPSHILNGHMRALIALQRLADASGDIKIMEWLKRGTDSLLRWLPRYDAGYALRYDLNPRKQNLLFRVANPYGYEGLPLAIESLALVDPVTGTSHTIDVSSDAAFQGDSHIAGVHWAAPETIGDRSARRLLPMHIEDPYAVSGPHSYFYFTLPGDWTDNLRTRDYELEITYFDETAGHLTIQQRSIAPGQAFRDLRDGDLLLSGEGVWRKWKIPLRTVDLGYPVGEIYAVKHSEYLAAIAAMDQRFIPWARIAHAYQGSVSNIANGSKVTPKPEVVPVQTPVLPILSLDQSGVVLQHLHAPQSKLDATAESSRPPGNSIVAYSPYMIADQLLRGEEINRGMQSAPLPFKREAALRWFLDHKNQTIIGNAVFYRYPFDNVYNDVVSKAPWSSAFGQACVLKALMFAADRKMAENLDPLIAAVVKGYTVATGDGGIRSTGLDGVPFYEEVPNNTHVLNAQLLSSVMLHKAAGYLNDDKEAERLFNEGVAALRARLYDFDAGYWLRYDLNPRKQILLQLDWHEGTSSPLVDRVTLSNPETGNYVEADVGTQGDYAGIAAHISGTDWGESQTIEENTVRGFVNGYALHGEPLKGGTRHNVYLSLALPDRPQVGAQVQTHVLRIRYKDVAPGLFGVSIQAINEGNFLTFAPLRQSALRTIGDGNWKEAVIFVRPQDLGWYKGPDYQRYEVEQLKQLAEVTGDWFFVQYAARHGNFLKRQQEGAPFAKAFTNARHILLNPEIAAASKTYEGFGFDNALDGDPNDNYVAGIEGEDAYVELRFNTPVVPEKLNLVWENADNYARHVRISSCGSVLADKKSDRPMNDVELTNARPLQSLRIVFQDFAGQPRLLLRKLNIKGMKVGAGSTVEYCRE